VAKKMVYNIEISGEFIQDADSKYARGLVLGKPIRHVYYLWVRSGVYLWV
jgi:hypothetical protein